MAVRRGEPGIQVLGDTLQPIDLARASDFKLGGATVRPSLRQVITADGRETVLEPRVMQVLAALASAKGAILSRDDLILICWAGRIVGEDAINRVISRLRRLSDEIGGFRIETITKVGYRIIEDGSATSRNPEIPVIGRPRGSNRRLLIAGSVAAVAGAGASLLLWSRRTPDAPDVTPLIVQAITALEQGTVEGVDQSIGLLRRAVELSPRNAAAWGALAFCYATATHTRAPRFQPDFAARAREAASRADSLAPGEPTARTAMALMGVTRGRWAERERALRDVIADHPDYLPARLILAELLGAVGRWRESAELLDAVNTFQTPTPGRVQRHVHALWASGRLEEADRAIARAISLYPSHFAVWFAHFHLLLYTGRAHEALSKVENLDARPETVDEVNFQRLRGVAKAMVSQSADDVTDALGPVQEAAKSGAGHAENAIQYAAALGRGDVAFEICDAYFFAKGFTVPEVRFAARQKTYTPANDRRTNFLFFPSTALLRSDPRFARLTQALGLEAYWRAAGSPPDYKVV